MHEEISQTSLAIFAKLVGLLGRADFADELIIQLNNFAEVNHISLVHMEQDGEISYILSSSDDSVNITKSMQQLYLSIFYKIDPNTEFLSHFDEGERVILKRLKQKDIEDSDYRRLWYEKMGIIDRTSIITKEDKGLYCLNLFRAKTAFTPSDMESFDHLKVFLSALVVKHAHMSGSLSTFMDRRVQVRNIIERLHHVDASLTTREKEVCARIILGMSSEGIGLDLDIKTQSVLTYRKRAYARLNISSQNELFAKCLMNA